MFDHNLFLCPAETLMGHLSATIVPVPACRMTKPRRSQFVSILDPCIHCGFMRLPHSALTARGRLHRSQQRVDKTILVIVVMRYRSCGLGIAVPIAGKRKRA